MMKIIHFLLQTLLEKLISKMKNLRIQLFTSFVNIDLRFKRSVSKVTILPHNHL